MQLSRTFARRLLCGTLFSLASLCLLSFLARAQTPAATGSGGSKPSATAVTPSAHDPLLEAAFDHFYNMDYDRAIQELGRLLDRHPDDPSEVNHLLSVFLMIRRPPRSTLFPGATLFRTTLRPASQR